MFIGPVDVYRKTFTLSSGYKKARLFYVAGLYPYKVLFKLRTTSLVAV